jgi:putative tricarboxylic transport membrane protein
VSDETTQGERRPDRAALVIAALLAAVAAVVAADTYNLPEGVATYSRIGPRAFPYAIAAGLALLAVATALDAWRGAFPEREPDDYRPLAWIVGGLVAQLALISFTGFSVATGAVFAATARGFGYRPLWISYPAGVVLSLAIWLAFAEGLNLVLPAGPPEKFLLEQFRGLIDLLSGAGPAPTSA